MRFLRLPPAMSVVSLSSQFTILVKQFSRTLLSHHVLTMSYISIQGFIMLFFVKIYVDNFAETG